jgi:hypothetical protein
MKNIGKFLVIISVLTFGGIQSAFTQTYFSLKVNSLCPDNCTTQENCYYKFSWILIDQCGEDDEIYCWDSTYIRCDDMYAGYEKQVICSDCTEATHDPCFLVAGKVQKVCTGPGGSHVICEDTDIKYKSCGDLSQQGLVKLEFDF